MSRICPRRGGGGAFTLAGNQLNLTGNLAFGYNGVFADQLGDTNQMNLGGDADLSGYYYNPNFLNFRVSPYYNRTQLNSSYQSIFSSKGVSAFANLFSGSHTPVGMSFGKSYNNEGQIFIAGAPSVETRGRSQSFNIPGGLNYEGLPTVSAGFGVSSNSYDILGSNATGSGSGRVFNIGSSYTVAGFNLGASYANSRITQQLPQLVDLNTSREENTYQNTFQVTMNRYLGWDSANVGASFDRTHFTTDYTGNTSDQTYDSFSTFFNAQPLGNLSVSANMNYSTNYSAALLGSVILPPNSGTAAIPAQNNNGIAANQFSSDYLAYGARALYTITKELTADGGVDHRSQTFLGSSYDSNTANGGLGYGHRFMGGQFSAHYGASWYASGTSNGGAVGQSGSVLYAHDLLGWHNSGDFQISRNVETAIANFTSTGYGLGLNTSKRFTKQWNLLLGAHMSKNNIEGLSNSDSLSRNLSTTVAGNKVSFSGSYSRSSGNALQFANGLITAPAPGQVLLPGLLVRYGGNSYSFASAYYPTRHFQITGSYAHSRYRTSNITSISDNLFYRFDIKSEYTFRQMNFVAGFGHLTQGIGATFNNPATVNSVYVGVSRHFDAF